jgi:hypothetical protein
MKYKLLCAAIAAVMTCAPASATEPFRLWISGTVTGTTTTYNCGPGMFNCVTYSPFSQDVLFDMPASSADYLDGSHYFSWGNAYTEFGLYGGLISTSGGSFVGTDLTFNRATPDIRFCGSSCFATQVVAGASTFQVSTAPPIPEPSTWAMMLLGFGAIGVSIRRGRKTAPAARLV